MFNKIATATSSCPMTSPKWRSGVEVSVESIKNREEELFRQFLEVQKREYPEQTGQICDCE